jgi:hypothetical protein
MSVSALLGPPNLGESNMDEKEDLIDLKELSLCQLHRLVQWQVLFSITVFSNFELQLSLHIR